MIDIKTTITKEHENQDHLISSFIETENTSYNVETRGNNYDKFHTFSDVPYSQEVIESDCLEKAIRTHNMMLELLVLQYIK
jgi:hypothetical protein